MVATVTYGLETIEADFQANTNVAGDQLAPDVLGLSNGGYVVAYNNGNISAGFTLLDFYDANGTSLGGWQVPAEWTMEAVGTPSLTEMGNGNVVVIWDGAAAEYDVGLVGAIFTPEGVQIGTDFEVTTELYEKVPQVTALTGEDAGFVVAYQVLGGIGIEVFDENGNSISGEQLITDIIAGGSSEPVITGLADGGFVVTWTQENGTNLELCALIFEADGTVREVNGSTDPFVVAANGDNAQPAITALPNGNWAIAYTDTAWADEDVAITLTIMGPNGEVVMPFMKVNQSSDGNESDPDITVLDNGFIVVSWTYPYNPGVDDDVHCRIFDQNGNPITINGFGSVLVLDHSLVNEVKSTVSGILAGQFVAAWQDAETDGSGGQITATVKELVRTTTGDGTSETLSGDDIRDIINGNGGVDTLNGFGGNDTLDGGGGADTMIGGHGDDTYIVDNAGDMVEESSGSGVDTVSSTVTFTLGGGLENLLLNGGAAINGTGNAAANSIGGNSAANVLSGLGQNDTLVGYGGNDTLNGGAGADAMTGGNGDDTYVVENAGDIIVEQGSSGTDLVQSTITFTLSASVENLVLSGAAAVNGTGNAAANALTGNSAANTLSGLAQDDTLTGFGGADTLNGGAGMDAMSGGNGDDTYVVDNAGDTASEASGSGIDTVSSTVSFTLAAGIETLVLNGGSAINGTGNGGANTMYGNSGVNRLDGNGGADTMSGFGGADVFVFDDGDGADTVADFQNGSDKCDLTAVAGVDEFADLVLTDTGAGVKVDYGTGSFELANAANFAAIDASDFIFA